MIFRKRRLENEIRRVISSVLLNQLRSSLTILITIKRVILNNDYSEAKVYYSILHIQFKELKFNHLIVNELKLLRGSIRFFLGKLMFLRRVPNLQFLLERFCY